MNQGEPKPQLEQPYYWTMPSKLCILGNGSGLLPVAAVGISKSEFTKEGGKRLPINACISAVSTLFSFYFTLSFFSVISLLVLCVSCLSRYPPSTYGCYSYLYWFKPMRFLYFTIVAHQPFLFVVSTSSELPITLLVIRSPLHLSMPNAFSFFHYSLMSITKHSRIHCMFQLGLLLKQDPRRSKKHLMG